MVLQRMSFADQRPMELAAKKQWLAYAAASVILTHGPPPIGSGFCGPSEGPCLPQCWLVAGWSSSLSAVLATVKGGDLGSHYQ